MKSIAAGGGVTFAVTGEGDLYGWGNNKDVRVSDLLHSFTQLLHARTLQGQLGLSDTKDRLLPFVVSALHTDPRHSRISTVRCHMTASALVYVWHFTHSGRCSTD